ncbi:MAG: phosphate uptake regulator PhoU [Thermoproteota archaeon]|jgi:phosphate uptake regulator|nr:phosphate uptake regulator PhoU [Thermoproteota archaeon]
MIRKVQKIGNSYYIALPSKWIKEYSINKGTELKLEMKEDGKLVVSPIIEESLEEKEVTLNYDKNTIEKKILSYYLIGYNIIKIVNEEGFKTEERDDIIKISRKLSGLEIVDERRDLITLQNLIDESSINPIKLLFRMSAITSTMYVDAIKEAFNKGEILEIVYKRDEEVDRLYFLLVRQLRTLILRPHLLSKLELTLLDCLDLRIAAHFIEKIGDEAARLAEILGLNNEKIKAQFLKNLLDVASNLQILQEKSLVYFVRKKGNVEEIKSELLKLKDELTQLSENSSYHEIIILNILKEIIDFNVDICDLIMYP